MGLCTAFVFAALVEFTIVNFWFRKHRKSKENALALMLPFVSTASNLTAATQMSAAAKTENTMRANQKKVKTSFKNSYFSFFPLIYRVSHLLSLLIERKSIQFSIWKGKEWQCICFSVGNWVETESIQFFVATIVFFQKSLGRVLSDACQIVCLVDSLSF